MQKIILGLFLIIAPLAYSQHILTGQVLDKSNSQPVPGASVSIDKPEKLVVTDLDGNFKIENVTPGKHEILVSSLGYGTKTVSVVVPVNEPLQILLQASAIEMEEVIVSTPFHRLQSDNVMKVERTTIEELSRSGSLNLSEGISQIAGVETLTTGSGIGKPVIRGLSSNRVLVYTQGVRLENQQFGDEHGLGVSSSGLESAEVIKGPASLLYGSDAMGGVLYLNPERYAPANETELDAAAKYYTNTQGTEANAGFKYSGEKWKSLIRANYASHADYETGEGERVTNSRFNEFDLKAGIGYRTDSYKGDLRYNLNTGETGIPEEIGAQSTSKEMMEPYQWVQNHILSLDNSFYFKDSSLDVKLGYLFNDRKEFESQEEHAHEEEHEEEEHEEEGHEEEEHLEGEPALHMHLETFNYDLKYHFPTRGKFETILGLQGMYQTNSNLGEEILIPDARTTDIGIMATTHYHLEKLGFQAGLRFDHRDLRTDEMGTPGSEEYIESLEKSFNSYNGALGAMMKISDNFTTRLNLATGFRAPNLAELTSDGSHHGTNRYEVGNAELENEQNYQIDLVFEYENAHFEIFTNAFYNKINNYIYLNPTGEFIEEDPVFLYVQDDAKLYGGEAGIHIHPHPLDWLHLESSFETVIGERENSENLPLIPASSVLNTLRFEFPRQKWVSNSYASISLKTYFDQENTGNFETPTPGYSLLSAGFGGSVEIGNALLDLQISGRNLLDKTYISHLSRLKPDGIPNIGRNISMSAKISL